MNEWLEARVTALPYGRSTKMIDRDVLYPQFLAMLKKNLVGRAVVVFPHYSRYEEFVRDAGLNVVAQYDIYVHKSLTRKVVVLTYRGIGR